MQMKMRFIIFFVTITGLFFTSVIVLAALAAKRDYGNVFSLIDGFPNPNIA